MRRLALLAAVAALGVSLVAGPASTSAAPVAGSTGKNGTCVWKKKSKRIVRHVVRNGKKKRIVKIKRYWRCVPIPQQPAPTPVPEPTPTPVPPPPEPSAPSRLGVEATEWSYTLSRSRLVSGDLVVELNNSGEDPHNLNFAPGDGNDTRTGDPFQTIEAVGPSGQGSLRFTIAPGTYYLYCSLPTHEGLGMFTNLTVDP